MSEFIVDIEGVEQALAGMEDSMLTIQRTLSGAVQVIGANARDLVRGVLAGDRGTSMAAGVQARVIDAYAIDVLIEGEGAKRLQWAINGTPPHAIAAKRGQALRFPWGGGIHFYTRVWHPGTKPRDVLGRVFDDIRAMAEREVQQVQLD